MKVSEISGIVKGRKEKQAKKNRKLAIFIGMHNKGNMVIANIK